MDFIFWFWVVAMIILLILNAWNIFSIPNHKKQEEKRKKADPKYKPCPWSWL